MPNYSNNEFYKSLKKPPFQPPNWLFAPVWTLLYVIMGVSFIMILNAPPNSLKLIANIIFISQLIANLSWSPVFFDLNRIRTAFWICLLLVILVAAMIFVFYQISKQAGLINIPYLIWLCFALTLNFYIWRQNLPYSNK